MHIQTINPATEEILSSYPLLTTVQVNEHIDAAYETYLAWRRTDFSVRQQAMFAIASLLRQRKKEYASLMAYEMGKPVTAGRAEIEKCAWVCEHYAEHAES